MSDPIVQVASDLFGFERLRPGQHELVTAVTAGRDALGVLPTGAGKSAIFAIAGHMLGGPTIVISPLLSLQHDQIAGLEKHGLNAVALNSALGVHAHDDALDAASRGDLDYLFLSPEQLADADVVRAVAAGAPRLVAVDEAHLISEWGPDFRPDYLRIAAAIEALGRPTVVALTATASPPVRADIIERLALRDAFVWVTGFDRPNIHLSVQGGFSRDRDKLEALAHDVRHAARSGPGIVYAATRRGVEGLVADWNSRGLRAVAYHAGLRKTERLRVEDDFRDGVLDVVVATVAFGMGIDRPDIRWVVHADIPPSLDEYYQEIGRAGRDGAPAEAVLYFRSDDLRVPYLFAASTGPSNETVEAVADALTAAAAASPARTTTIARLVRSSGLTRRRVDAALLAMRDAGAVALHARGRVRILTDPQDALTATREAVERRRGVERSRAEAVEAYAEHRGCRRQFILEYFGEATSGPCANCDNCERSTSATACSAADPDAGEPFPRGCAVVHATFGPGEVLGYADGRMMVNFDAHGYKRLDVGLVIEGNLLTPAE